MNRSFLSSVMLAMAFVAMSSYSAFSAVTVVQTLSDLLDGWQQDYEGGTLAVSVAPESDTDRTPNEIWPSGGMIQTFKGDGKKLKAVGFFFFFLSNPLEGKEFKISLLDFGTGPITVPSNLNVVTKPVFTDTFRWGPLPSPANKRVFFLFSDASSVVLQADHYYGIVLEFPDANKKQVIVRVNRNAYADGRMSLGTIGNFDPKYMDRDAIFAVYTY